MRRTEGNGEEVRVIEDKKRKRLSGVALAGLLAVVLVGSSFAYWNQTSTIDNPFDTGEYGSTAKEDFIPKDGENWLPGVIVNKDVYAENTGDQDLIVRVRLDETWKRELTAPVNAGVVYKTVGGTDVYTTSQANPTDGLTAADGSVVTKIFDPSANWIAGAGGWYYYRTNLPGGQTTDKWLDAVQLLSDADLGRFETRYYATSHADPDSPAAVWWEYTGDMPRYVNASGPCAAGAAGAQPVLHTKAENTYAQVAAGVDVLGYSQSEYTLTVTVQTVQTTQEALNAMFGGGATFTPPSGTAWVLKN